MFDDNATHKGAAATSVQSLWTLNKPFLLKAANFIEKKKKKKKPYQDLEPVQYGKAR